MTITPEMIQELAEVQKGGDEKAILKKTMDLSKAAGFDVTKTPEYKNTFSTLNDASVIAAKVKELGGLDAINEKIMIATEHENNNKTAEQRVAELEKLNQELTGKLGAASEQHEGRITALNNAVESIIEDETKDFTEEQKSIVELMKDDAPEKRLQVIRQLKKASGKQAQPPSPGAPPPGPATPDELNKLSPTQLVNYKHQVGKGHDPKDVLEWINRDYKTRLPILKDKKQEV